MIKNQQTAQRIASVFDKVACARCTAKSRQTGQQCSRPAVQGSRTHKCEWHGALSTGPKTPEGKARSVAARTTRLDAYLQWFAELLSAPGERLFRLRLDPTYHPQKFQLGPSGADVLGFAQASWKFSILSPTDVIKARNELCHKVRVPRPVP